MRLDLSLGQQLRIQPPKPHPSIVVLLVRWIGSPKLEELLAEGSIGEHPPDVDAGPWPGVGGQQREAVQPAVDGVVARQRLGADGVARLDRDAVQHVAQRIVGEGADLGTAVRVMIVEDGVGTARLDQREVLWAGGADDREAGSG